MLRGGIVRRIMDAMALGSDASRLIPEIRRNKILVDVSENTNLPNRNFNDTSRKGAPLHKLTILLGAV